MPPGGGNRWTRFGRVRMAGKKAWYKLTRGNLRDVVLVLAFLSALFFKVKGPNLVIGYLLLGVGSFLHFVTKGILIRNVVLSNTGVYRVVRHPYYLANYLVDSSFCVVSGNLYLPLLYPFLFFWAYGPTLRKEDEFLSSQHPDAFSKHAAQTPQVFPDPASRSGWKRFFEGFSGSRISLKEISRLSRFWSLGLFLVLVHEVRIERLSGALDLIRPRRNDYDEFVLLLIAVVLYALSYSLTRHARESRLCYNV